MATAFLTARREDRLPINCRCPRDLLEPLVPTGERRRPHRVRKVAMGRVLLVAVVSLASFWGTGLYAQSAEGGLRILLTNDDGIEARGLQSMREALEAAGHDVTVVAPRENQSGSGARITTSGVLRYAESSPGLWHVDGSPADAVLFGLNRVMSGAPPDLVVSGSNFGHNTGSSTLVSGTVGAAITAAQRGIPAIAVSVGLRLSERSATPRRFPSTLEAFDPAARFTVQLIEHLREHPRSDGRLLPPGTALSVNYPALGDGRVEGVRVARVARTRDFRMGYREGEAPGEVRVSIAAAPRDSLEDGTDLAYFARGYITITLLDPYFGAGAARADSLAARLSLLGGATERRRP